MANMKILLVEDSKFLRLATESAMVRAGYEVTSAADGKEGPNAWGEKKLPDLILLDMLLPKLSGPDVLKALKLDAATAAIPVVVMSGLSQKNAARLEKDGPFAFLEKSELALDQGPEPLLVKLESGRRTEVSIAKSWSGTRSSITAYVHADRKEQAMPRQGLMSGRISTLPRLGSTTTRFVRCIILQSYS
jgi:CheY-like chemotaxis protein